MRIRAAVYMGKYQLWHDKEVVLELDPLDYLELTKSRTNQENMRHLATPDKPIRSKIDAKDDCA